MHLHNYIIICRNKQDNSRLCTVLDNHPPKVCCRHLKVIKSCSSLRGGGGELGNLKPYIWLQLNCTILN